MKNKSIRSLEWMDQANCLGEPSVVFFSEGTKFLRVARSICEECVVRTECLDYAVSNKIQHGIWGGKTETERRRIRLQNFTVIE